MPSVASITVGRGDRVTYQFTVDGAPDITGWTVAAYVKDVVQPQRGLDPVLTLTIGSGITLTTPTAGVVTMSLTSAQTKDTLKIGTFTFDVWRTDAGQETILASGTITVIPVARW